MHESSQTDKDREAKKTPELIRNALTNKLEQKFGIGYCRGRHIPFFSGPPPLLLLKKNNFQS